MDGANDGPKDGSPEHPWPTIGEGLAQAAAGDRVLVAEGTWAENLVIATPITLTGGFASYTSPISWTQDSAVHLTTIDGQGRTSPQGKLIPGWERFPATWPGRKSAKRAVS